MKLTFATVLVALVLAQTVLSAPGRGRGGSRGAHGWHHGPLCDVSFTNATKACTATCPSQAPNCETKSIWQVIANKLKEKGIEPTNIKMCTTKTCTIDSDCTSLGTGFSCRGWWTKKCVSSSQPPPPQDCSAATCPTGYTCETVGYWQEHKICIITDPNNCKRFLFDLMKNIFS